MREKPSDEQTTIKDLRELTKKFVSERNWESYHTPRALAEAISIEAAELLENFLFSTGPLSKQQQQNLEEEMADVFIYLMSLCNSLQLPNFSAIIHHKMEKNKKKYPIHQFSGNNYAKQ